MKTSIKNKLHHFRNDINLLSNTINTISSPRTYRKYEVADSNCTDSLTMTVVNPLAPSGSTGCVPICDECEGQELDTGPCRTVGSAPIHSFDCDTFNNNQCYNNLQNGFNILTVFN